jgi:hypothetical protein
VVSPVSMLPITLTADNLAQTYEKGTADDDDDTTLDRAWLRVDGRDLVLNALEGKLLY